MYGTLESCRKMDGDPNPEPSRGKIIQTAAISQRFGRRTWVIHFSRNGYISSDVSISDFYYLAFFFNQEYRIILFVFKSVCS